MTFKGDDAVPTVMAEISERVLYDGSYRTSAKSADASTNPRHFFL